MRMKVSLMAAAALCVALALFSASAVAAPGPRPSGSVPQGFFGTDMDPWALSAAGVDVGAAVDTAARSGIETIRFPLYWSKVQPYSSLDQVPDGAAGSFTVQSDSAAPYNWVALDAFVLSAARNGIALLPTVMGAPAWAADPRYTVRTTGTYVRPPKDFGQFAQFVVALVNRYGPNGTTWAANPGISAPIRKWQIWNEPNLASTDKSTGFYWPQHAGEKQVVIVGGRRKELSNLYWAPTYVEMLKAVRPALKAADPNAKLMLASLTNSGFLDLDLVYKAGGKGLFDSIGANLFTSVPTCLYTKVCSKGMPTLINLYRSALKRNLDSALPMTVTEFSWSAGKDFSFPINSSCASCWLLVTKTGQANNIKTAGTEFTRARVPAKVDGAYWYTWASNYTPDTVDGTPEWSVWDYSGLNRISGSTLIPMTSLTAYRGKLMTAEGCREKSNAFTCSK